MKKVLFTALIGLLYLSGCATVEPYDYTELLASKPRSILVLPPINESVEVNAPYTFLSSISKPLAERGYYVFPVAVVDRLMKENGLPTPEEMNAVPLEKLYEHTGADAVLYTRIIDWGQRYQVLSSKAVTHAELRLIDARTGKLLWTTVAYAEQSSGDGGGGLAGALIGAIATQIMASYSDQTPALSSRGNTVAIYNNQRGLLPGPYAPQKSKKQG